MSDRAVSETLGTVILFAAVVASVTFAYALGAPVIEAQKDASSLDSAEEGFKLLDQQMNDHIEMGVERRTTTFGSVDNPMLLQPDMTVFTVQVDGTEIGSGSASTITYQQPTARIIYDSGATFQGNSDSVVTTSEADVYVQNGTAVINMIELKGQDSARVVDATQPYQSSQAQDISIRSYLSNTTNAVRTGSGPYDVEVRITSPYSSEWNTMLSNSGYSCTNIDSNTVSCTASVDTVLYTKSEVSVRFN